MSEINVVQALAPLGEQLAQLAEESVELAHAALKARRALGVAGNPTPVRLSEALGSLREEIADVQLCLRVLGYDPADPDCKKIMSAKLTRWATRLQAEGGIPCGESGF